MIFVTVGTHEQQFDRLVEFMDKWAGLHDEDVILQTGYSMYVPLNCKSQPFFSYQEMCALFDEARIVITHGGPASFIAPLRLGKVPIVVPRKKKYKEHINDHQTIFCRNVEKRMHSIILVEDVRELNYTIDKYEEILKVRHKDNLGNSNEIFCKRLDEIVGELFED